MENPQLMLLKGERLKAFPQGYLLSPRLFNNIPEVLAKTTRQEKKEVIQIGKLEVKLLLFADDIILYVGILRSPQKKY